jgi:hypothetical protein
VVVAQAVMVALGVSYTVKALVGRERPDVHALAPADKPGDAEDNLSFYSGHTTLATSLAVATGTVATIRGYRGARAVWLARWRSPPATSASPPIATGPPT